MAVRGGADYAGEAVEEVPSTKSKSAKRKCAHWFANAPSKSPGEALEVRNEVEVAIAAQEREVVPATNRCNPQVIGRDGLASFFQFKADGRVGDCRILIDVQDAN